MMAKAANTKVKKKWLGWLLSKSLNITDLNKLACHLESPSTNLCLQDWTVRGDRAQKWKCGRSPRRTEEGKMTTEQNTGSLK